MNKSTINLPENTIFEVLVTTTNNQKPHTKPFGMKIQDKQVVLTLFPNKTLNNIKNNKEFLIQFTLNPLIYTKASLNKLTSKDYQNNNILKEATVILRLKVNKIIELKNNDIYGENIITTIFSTVTDIKQENIQVPAINRATTKIIELLVDYTRYNYMDSNQKSSYINKIIESENIIRKTGNKNHNKSLNLIKKELNIED